MGYFEGNIEQTGEKVNSTEAGEAALNQMDLTSDRHISHQQCLHRTACVRPRKAGASDSVDT